MNIDEMKNRISIALKDPILQQSFEIMCKENAELKAQIEKMKCCGNCKYFRFVNGAEYYTCIKDGKRNGEDYRSCGFNLEKWKLWV